MGVAICLRGVPEGPGLVEAVGAAIALFGSTLVLSHWRLIKREQR